MYGQSQKSIRIAASAALLLGLVTFSPVEAFQAGERIFFPAFQRIPVHSLGRSRSIPTPLHSADQSSESTTTQAVNEQQLTVEDVANQLQEAKAKFDKELGESKSVSEAENIRVAYLGKKGVVNGAMSFMRLLSPEDKPKLGQVVNAIKEELEERVTTRKKELEIEEIELRMEEEKIDVTMPGLPSSRSVGKRHPLSITMEKAVEIFIDLGYDTVTDASDSPEIESDYYCFEALNCPKDHPARDMQDTLYLNPNLEVLLRTHTSSVQIRQLERRKPPLRIVAPGRVYRRDDIDATHSMVFHQVEILAVEEKGKLHLGHLKGTVDHFLRSMFGPDIKVRYRGSYFPFTEPSMEVDVFFRGKWLEVLGCGMVDPNVLEMAGIDSEKYGGFAAGFGVERFAMVIHGITDIREFYKNDSRFLDQFPHFADEGVFSFLQGKDYGKDRTYDNIDPNFDRMEPNAEVLAKIAALDTEEDQVNGEVKPVEASTKEPSSDLAATGGSEAIDVSKLDIRVGVITKAWVHEEADKLFCEEIDIGEEAGPRRIASGLRAHYNLEDLEGQRVLVLANLKARKLAGFASHGMVLCAASEDGSKVKFVEPPKGANIGERVTVEGYDGEPATENQIIKKKMLETIFPDLKTNNQGVASYKGVPLSTSAGECIAQDNLANSPVG